jgi:hypothetical protein
MIKEILRAYQSLHINYVIKQMRNTEDVIPHTVCYSTNSMLEFTHVALAEKASLK